MVTLDELEITTVEGSTADDLWTATSTAYPEFIGSGATEEDAKQNLVDQINEGEEGAKGEGESTEG